MTAHDLIQVTMPKILSYDMRLPCILQSLFWQDVYFRHNVFRVIFACGYFLPLYTCKQIYPVINSPKHTVKFRHYFKLTQLFENCFEYAQSLICPLTNREKGAKIKWAKFPVCRMSEVHPNIFSLKNITQLKSKAEFKFVKTT